MGHRATPTAIEFVSRRAGVAFIEEKGRVSGGRGGMTVPGHAQLGSQSVLANPHH